ncbi:unnamed protein product, partial [marine sediment metagenome]
PGTLNDDITHSSLQPQPNKIATESQRLREKIL